VQNEWPVLPALPPTDFYDWMASTTDLSDVAAANTPAPLEQLTGHAGSSSNATEDVAADVASTSAPARAAQEWQPNVGGQLGVGIDPLIDACRAAHGGEARWSHYRRAAHASRNVIVSAVLLIICVIYCCRCQVASRTASPNAFAACTCL
jgi:hypothetical protein